MKTIRIYLLVAISMAFIADIFAQTTYNCNGLNPYSATQSYPISGTAVYFNNVKYTSNYWTQNQEPDQNSSGSGSPWTKVGACTLPIQPNQVICTGYPAYSSTVTYDPNGSGTNNFAIFNNVLYQASWSVGNDQPNINTSGAWQMVGQCILGTFVVTGTLSPFSTFAENPSAPQQLTVNGSGLTGGITVTAPANFLVSLTATPISSYSSSLTISETGGNASATVYVIYNPSLAGTQNGTLSISSPGISPYTINVNGQATGLWVLDADQVDISNGNTGHVGIGTATPLYDLHIVSQPTLNANAASLFLSPFNWNQPPSGAVETSIIYLGDANHLIGVERSPLPGGWSGMTFSDPIGFVFNGPGVGIGVHHVPSGYALAVNGSILTDEILVRSYSIWSNYPDYVFKPDYKLKPLSEVESYIAKNGHLPEVPSAANVEKDGVNLGEMNSILLRKIEELTLYNISLDKQVRELKETVEGMKKLEKKVK